MDTYNPKREVEKPKGKRALRAALAEEALRRAEQLDVDVEAMRRVLPASQHLGVCLGTAAFLRVVAEALR